MADFSSFTFLTITKIPVEGQGRPVQARRVRCVELHGLLAADCRGSRPRKGYGRLTFTRKDRD